MFLTENEWVVGDIGDGSREYWQCPQTCRQVGIYDGSDPKIQFPKGLHTHIKAGRADVTTFHQGMPFQPYRVRVVKKVSHNGSIKNVLRMEGGNLSEQAQCMLVRKFLESTSWADKKEVKCNVWFMPTEEGFSSRLEASSHLFANFELRGERSVTATDGGNQVIGFFVRGDKMFIRYWGQKDGVTNKGMERIDIPYKVLFGRWYKLSIILTPLDKEGQWDFTITLNSDGKRLFTVENQSPICFIDSVHSYAIGDERPNDNDGGVFYWECPKITV